jgi:hypothetical protein
MRTACTAKLVRKKSKMGENDDFEQKSRFLQNLQQVAKRLVNEAGHRPALTRRGYRSKRRRREAVGGDYCAAGIGRRPFIIIIIIIIIIIMRSALNFQGIISGIFLHIL